MAGGEIPSSFAGRPFLNLPRQMLDAYHEHGVVRPGHLIEDAEKIVRQNIEREGGTWDGKDGFANTQAAVDNGIK